MKEGLRSREKADDMERDDIPLRCLVPLKTKKKKRARLVLSDTDSDNDLIVSACKKVGRKKNNGGSCKRKRSPEVECSEEETEICVLKLEPDENEVKRSRLDVFEYNEDDLVDDYKDLKKGNRNKRRSDMLVKKHRGAGRGGELSDEEMKVGRLKEKSIFLKKSRGEVKDENSDSVVVDDRKRKLEVSDGEEDRRSRSVAGSVGSRTRSAVNLKKTLENSGSSEMKEKRESPLSLSTDKKKNKLGKKNTSLKPSLKSSGSNSSKKEASVEGKQSVKAELSSSSEIPRKKKANMEKELIREQIKNMVERAGWTIDYRPRKSKDYKDAVYVDHAGSGYWSCLKAYYALQKQCEGLKDGEKYFGTDFVFTPISDEKINKLTRLTKRKIEREKMKNRKAKMGNKEEGAVDRKIVRKYVKKNKNGSMNIERLNHHNRKHGNLLKERLKKNGFKQRRKQGVKRAASSDDTDKVDNDMHNGTPKRKTQKGSSTSTLDSNKVDNDVHNGMPKGKRRGGYSLLVRSSDTEINSGDNQFMAYPGKLSVLSWLIDSEVLPLGGKVKFMNKKRTQAILEGSVTRNGINCGCCSEIVTISEFEKHAGSKVQQSSQNLFAENGVPLIQCQIDAWNKQKESEHSGFYCIDVTSDDPNDDSCCICGDGGDLICCDGCPSTFHQSCLDIQVLPKGDWHCHNCRCKFCGLVHCIDGEGDEATILESLTCSLCEEKYHVSCALQRNAVPADSDGSSAPFCGQNCRELFEKLQKLLGVKHELEAGFSWTIIQRCNLKSNTSLCGLPQKVDCNSKLSLALSVMDECFLPTIDERSGINLMHNVVYNCGSNFIRLNYSGFYTFLLERGDEIISAATVRIRGGRFAEMPFIGTRHIYRRQGMCRRLLNAIELSLSSLNIEKLIIPAISELMDTWTSVFGFIPLEQTFRQEARYLNMVVFPGVALLQKLFPKHSSTEETITDGSVKDMGPKTDNHVTAEQTDNSDLGSVEPVNHDSDESVVSHANEMTAEAITAETGTRASSPLVHDTSDACNSSAQECSNTEPNSILEKSQLHLVEEKLSVKLCVELDLQAPIKVVVDGAYQVDDTQMNDVDSNADDTASDFQEACTMNDNIGPDSPSLGGASDKNIALHNSCVDIHLSKVETECCNSQSQDESSTIANGTVTSLPAGKERVTICHDLENGKASANTDECNLETSSKIPDLKVMQKTENEYNLSNGAEDPCEVKFVVQV